jgi:hypothetical protein
MMHLDRTARRSRNARSLGFFASLLLSLALGDLLLQAAFPIPADPRVQPSRPQTFFNYGRSIQGKLGSMIGRNDEGSAPIVRAGWIDTECAAEINLPPTGSVGISIYGNSFAVELGEALESANSSVSVKLFGGPGAGPNHSYGCFVRESDGGRDHNPIQIIGITATSLPRMTSIWGATTSFEYPQPFTFSRYYLNEKGELAVHEPSVRSPADLRLIVSDHGAWRNWLSELEAEDYFYSPIFTIFQFADHSILLRMIRRSFGQAFLRQRTSELRDDMGNYTATDIKKVLPILLKHFARRAQSDWKRPIVVLFEEFGRDDALCRLLCQALQNDHIEYLTSSAVVSSADIRNFRRDGHFSKEANQKLAAALMRIIRQSEQTDN